MYDGVIDALLAAAAGDRLLVCLFFFFGWDVGEGSDPRVVAMGAGGCS